MLDEEVLAQAALRHRKGKASAAAAAAAGAEGGTAAPAAPAAAAAAAAAAEPKPATLVTTGMLDAVRMPASVLGPAGAAPHTWLLLGVAALAMAAYANSVTNDLAFDDHLAIRNNAIVDPLQSGLKDILTHDFWGKDLTKIDSHKSWRPLTTLSFRLNVQLAGGFDAWSLHLTNNVLHAAASALVAHVGHEMFRCRLTAALGGALFALHPVHTEAVSSVVGRAEVLCALFALAALLCYQRRQWEYFVYAMTAAVLCKETGITYLGVVLANDALVWGGWAHASRGLPPLWSPRAHGRTRLLFARRVALCCAIFAMFAFVRLTIMVDPGGDWKDSTLEKSKLIRRAENPFKFLSGLERYLSYGYLQARYAWLLLWPSVLCCEYSFDCIPSVKGLADPRNLESVGLAAALAALAVSLLRWAPTPDPAGGEAGGEAGDGEEEAEEEAEAEEEEEKEKEKEEEPAEGAAVLEKDEGGGQAKAKAKAGKKLGAAGRRAAAAARAEAAARAALVTPTGVANGEAAARATCVAMTLLPYLPASGIFTVGTLVAERLLYLPSIGACLLAGRLFARGIAAIGDVDYSDIAATHRLDGERPVPPLRLGRNRTKAGVTVLLFAGAAALMATATFRRTRDWENDETLFRAALDVCPNSAKINQQFGQIQLNHASPLDPTAHKTVAARSRASAEAERLFLRAREIDGDFCDIDFNLGMVAAGKNDYGVAAGLFKKSLDCSFTSQKAFSNLQLIWNAYMQVRASPERCATLARGAFFASLARSPALSHSFARLLWFCAAPLTGC